MLRRTGHDLGPDFYKPYVTYMFERARRTALEKNLPEEETEGWGSFASEPEARRAGGEWVGSDGADVPLDLAQEVLPRVRDLIRHDQASNDKEAR
jgi:hypothetical protein